MPSRLRLPRDMMPGHPQTVDAYLAFALQRARAAGRQLVEDRSVVPACVNGGNWVFRCPHCGTFSMIDPDFDVAACFGAGCYRYFRTVLWPEPDERAAIEAALVSRPFEHQHFGFARAYTGDLSAPVESAQELADETMREMARLRATRRRVPAPEDQTP